MGLFNFYIFRKLLGKEKKPSFFDYFIFRELFDSDSDHDSSSYGNECNHGKHDIIDDYIHFNLFSGFFFNDNEDDE